MNCGVEWLAVLGIDPQAVIPLITLATIIAFCYHLGATDPKRKK